MATTTQTKSSLSPAARPVDWARWRDWLLAVGVAALGALLLAYELALLPAGLQAAAGVGGPAALMALGAWVALRGGPGARRNAPAFAVDRGQAACAELLVDVGSHDFELRAFAALSQLAVGEFPNPSGPAVDVRGTATRLTLTPGMVDPHLAGAPWRLAAARALPWDLDLRASGGDLKLDLRDLNVASLRVRSAFGNAVVALPGQGPAELILRLALGDLALALPEGVEAKLRLEVGPLVGVTVTNRRLVNVAPNEWMTPLYPTTAHRCTVLVDMSAGELAVA